MENDHLVGYSLAVLVGISLGLIGSGGSILSVPIFVYIMGMHPALAAAYSLFVVGVSALVSGVQKAKDGLVDFRKVIAFGVPTLIAVFITRKIIVLLLNLIELIMRPLCLRIGISSAIIRL